VNTPICAQPTRKYPQGRTGTSAGYEAHRSRREKACEACLKARAVIAQAKYVPNGKPPGRPAWQTPEGKRERQRLYGQRWRAANLERARELSRESDARRDPERRRKNSRSTYLRRRARLDELKSAPCTDCGVQYPPYVMQFDHRDPAMKLINVGRASWTWERVLEEVAKCDLVCANCHMERTYGPGYRQRQAG
jgi:hypothetical protein